MRISDGVQTCALPISLEAVNQERYADHTVILLTHSYLNSASEHIVKEGYPITDGNYGAAVWEKLVKPSKNIQLVFSGHIGKPDDILGHIGFRTDTNAGGKTVQQMAFNAQRSEERRVGKECVSTCSSGWSPYH